MERSQQNFMTLVSSPQIPDAQSHRTELLDVLSEVKTKVQDRLGSVDFPLPQFILIGKQSVCMLLQCSWNIYVGWQKPINRIPRRGTV
jgi:hypothetical protein